LTTSAPAALYGDHIAIAATTLTNDVENGVAGRDCWRRNRLDIGPPPSPTMNTPCCSAREHGYRRRLDAVIKPPGRRLCSTTAVADYRGTG